MSNSKGTQPNTALHPIVTVTLTAEYVDPCMIKITVTGLADSDTISLDITSEGSSVLHALSADAIAAFVRARPGSGVIDRVQICGPGVRAGSRVRVELCVWLAGKKKICYSSYVDVRHDCNC